MTHTAGGSGGAPDNFESLMVCRNYPNMVTTRANGDKSNLGCQDTVQALGHPWIRMASPQEIFTTAFADKTNGSRYDGTFTTTFRANWQKDTQYSSATALNANNLTIRPGDAVLTFFDKDHADIQYPSGCGENAIGAGTLPGHADYVLGPSGISNLMYSIL